MEDSTIVLIISFFIIGLIAAFCIWVVVKDKRYFKKMHPELVERWDQVATALGLTWVVPIDHVRKTRSPPALLGKVQSREVYLALQDESSEESLRARWDLVVHVGLGGNLVARKERKPVLKGLKRRRGEVRIKKRQLLVNRPGLYCGADEVVAFVHECIAGAKELDASR